jgi:hypothetical protein
MLAHFLLAGRLRRIELDAVARLKARAWSCTVTLKTTPPATPRTQARVLGNEEVVFVVIIATVFYKLGWIH